MIHKTLVPEFSGLLLVAGSWAPLAASWYETTVKWAQLIGLFLGIAVSLLAVIDFTMKIHWKAMRIREEKRAKRDQLTGNKKKSSEGNDEQVI